MHYNHSLQNKNHTTEIIHIQVLHSEFSDNYYRNYDLHNSIIAYRKMLHAPCNQSGS